MAQGERESPEFVAFKRCIATLVTTINYNLETILDRALAQELITDAHQTKWLDKNTPCDERTRQFLVYIQTRIKVEPKTFNSFVRILQQDTADFMGRELERKLKEVEEERTPVDTHTSTSEECKHCSVLENRLSDAEKRLSDAEKKLIDMQHALEKEEAEREEQDDEMLERLMEVERKQASEDSTSYHSKGLFQELGIEGANTDCPKF